MCAKDEMTQQRRVQESHGFSLVEVLVAMGILVVAIVSVAELLVRSIAANLEARTTTYAVALAEQKLEDLRSLPFGPEGLRPSPPGSLSHDTEGYVDYLDLAGTPVDRADRGAPFTRRWSVTPLPDDPEDVLVIQVFVTGRPARRAEIASGVRLQGDARTATIRMRKASP